MSQIHVFASPCLCVAASVRRVLICRSISLRVGVRQELDRWSTAECHRIVPAFRRFFTAWRAEPLSRNFANASPFACRTRSVQVLVPLAPRQHVPVRHPPVQSASPRLDPQARVHAYLIRNRSYSDSALDPQQQLVIYSLRSYTLPSSANGISVSHS